MRRWTTRTRPRGELWRPLLVALLFVALLIPFLIPKAPRKGLNALLLLVGLPIVAYVLLLGGGFGLPHVETPLWGGLMVTMILSFVGIAVSLPLGILLALGRRSPPANTIAADSTRRRGPGCGTRWRSRWCRIGSGGRSPCGYAPAVRYRAGTGR